MRAMTTILCLSMVTAMSFAQSVVSNAVEGQSDEAVANEKIYDCYDYSNHTNYITGEVSFTQGPGDRIKEVKVYIGNTSTTLVNSSFPGPLKVSMEGRDNTKSFSEYLRIQFSLDTTFSQLPETAWFTYSSVFVGSGGGFYTGLRSNLSCRLKR